MNKYSKKILTSIICGCIVFFSFVIVSSASTSQSIDQLSMLEYKQSVFGEKMSSPTSVGQAGNETINTASGNLQLSATDLYLKGKGGLDVVIKRNYGSLISTEYKDELYGVEDMDIHNRVMSDKLIYKYYINNTSDYVYIYYDNEEQLLDKENANGEIYTSQNYVQHIIPCKTSAGAYEDVYQSLIGNNVEDIKEKGFIKHYELPSGTSVKLTRDKSLECDKVQYTSVNAYEAIGCKITPNYITIGEDWYFSLDTIDRISTVRESSGSYTDYTERGNLITRDGELLSYEVDYSYNSNKDIYSPDIGYIISNHGDKSKMYSIRIDYPKDSMDASDERDMGFRYTTKVTDYKGKKLYFDYRGNLVAEEDRFGNRILYDKTARKIIDTYGRVINLPKGTNNSIRVNGKEVVKYSLEIENNDKLDPYGLLEVDNKKHFKVNYNTDTDDAIVYTTQNHRNIYRLQASPNSMTVASAYNTDINCSELYPTLEEITLPTGAKIKYEYEKTNVFFNVKRFSYEKYKIKSRQDVEADGTVSNKYTYAYNNPTEGLLRTGREAHTTNIVRASDGYTNIDKYDNKGCLTSKETRAGDDYTISTFKYELNREGGYNLIQEDVKKYNKNNPSDYIKNVTNYEYNDVQMVTKKIIGNYTETYSYATLNYYLPTKTEIYRGDGLYNRIEYTNNGKSIIRIVTSDVKSNRATQVKAVNYRYNEFGDLIFDGEANKNYIYNYSDMSYNEDTDTEYNQGNSLEITESVTARGIVDEEGNNVSGTITASSVYDMFGNVISVEDANGNMTRYEYDNRQRLIKTTYPDNSISKIEYFDILNEIIATDENGNKSKLCYDSLGRYLEGYLFNPKNNTWILAEKNTYDSNGNIKTLLSNRNEDGKSAVKVEYSYYPDGRKKSEVVKNADNNELLSEYNVGRNYYYTNPNVTEGWPRRGITFFTVQYRNNGSDYINVTTDYDLFGNKVEEKIDGRAGGITYDTATTKYSYDYVGNLLTQQEPNLVNADSAEYSVQNVYNALGNIVKTTNINKKSATNEYNTTTGLLSKSTDFNGNATSYTYNCFNQLYTETLPTGGKQINYYDVNGNVAKVDTLRESNVYDSVRYVYDSRNRNIAVIGNDGEKDVVTQYEYDAVGNRTKLVQGLEEVSDLNKLSGKDYSMNTYKYNYRNQCISATDAMGQTQTYEYDLFGNVLKSVDRNGDTISYAYTPIGHLTSVNSSKDNTSISYLYDKLGNKISMTDTTGTTNYRYNTYNQLVKETKGSVVKDYTYDLNGNQISFKITDNGKVTLDETYSYNNLNQVSGITAADITANFTYDSNGNMLTYRRNGISTSYTYNSVNMPTSVTTNKGSVRYEKDTMTYYLNGNKKTTNDVNNNTTTYIYDGLGRLSSEKNTDGYSALYSYDNYGNRIEKAVDDGDNSQNVCYTYDKNNRLTSETFAVQGGQETNRYFYDANGNQTYKNIEKSIISTQKGYSLQLNDSGNGTEYEYDGLNRLVKADDGTSVATYTYDGNNLRQSKTVNGITTQHIYNGMNVVQEKERNSLKATYHRAGNQIIYSEVNGSKNFYVYNAQGNVSKLVNTAGETVSDYTFDAFGVQRTVNGDVYNPFRHNGEYYDEELGYTYLRNRYYDNASGRFISEDPVRDGLNWYSYCGGNPIDLIDPMGLFDYNTKLSYDPGHYSDDVKALQNELAWHGYLEDSDIDGYFGGNTLAAVNQYKEDNGLWNDGEYYGVVGLTTWKHLGLMYREQTDIDAGVQIMTIGAKQYFDISEAVNIAVIRATGEFQNHSGDFEWFRDTVGDYGKWNIKRNAEVWSSTLGISKNSYYYEKMFYGRPVVIDDIGNITYGYLGKAANFSERTLNAGSALNHFKNHGFGDWNNERSDQACIALGVLWYEGYDIQLRYGYGY